MQYEDVSRIKTYLDKSDNVIKYKIFIGDTRIVIENFTTNFNDFPRIIKKRLKKAKNNVQLEWALICLRFWVPLWRHSFLCQGSKTVSEITNNLTKPLFISIIITLMQEHPGMYQMCVSTRFSCKHFPMRRSILRCHAK